MHPASNPATSDVCSSAISKSTHEIMKKRTKEMSNLYKARRCPFYYEDHMASLQVMEPFFSSRSEEAAVVLESAKEPGGVRLMR